MASPHFSVRDRELRLNGRRLRDMQHIVFDMAPRSGLDYGDEAIVKLVSGRTAGHMIDAMTTTCPDPYALARGNPLVFFSLIGGAWPEVIGSDY